MAKEDTKHNDEGIVEQDIGVGTTHVPDLNDKAMEKRIVRKIDLWILPFICISYLINYLDRVSRANPLPSLDYQNPSIVSKTVPTAN